MADHWICSDQHYRHARIYGFTGLDGVTRIRERFKDVFEGDAFMIQAHNDIVKPEDHCWFLGDFCMGSPTIVDRHWTPVEWPQAHRPRQP